MAKADRFASIQPERGDVDSRSSASDVSYPCVAVDLICSRCASKDRRTRLARFAVKTAGQEFSPNEVWPQGEKSCLTIEGIPSPDDRVRLRYKMLCPICRHSPEVRSERVEELLKEIYVQGGMKNETHRV